MTQLKKDIAVIGEWPATAIDSRLHKTIRRAYEEVLTACARLAAFAEARPVVATGIIAERQEAPAVDDLVKFAIHARRPRQRRSAAESYCCGRMEEGVEMTRKLISSGGEWEDKAGYSRAVVDGEWVFVSGTTGFDYPKRTISNDVAEQAEQTFRNIEVALAEGGATLADTVRVVVYLVDARDFERVAPVFGRRFKGIKPANSTLIVAALIDPRMKIEIELTARKSMR